jgi:hypothetical protein
LIKIGRSFIFLFCLFVFSGFVCLSASETKDKHIRLLIYEKTGNFSLFYLTDVEKEKYSPLFNHRIPSATFMDVKADGVVYRLGKDRTFNVRIERHNEDPVVIYESAFLEVSQLFIPVRTLSSPNANGVKIKINIRNTGEEPMEVGMRFLLDTSLGEGRRTIHFATDNLNITKEMIIESPSEENYWITRGKNLSLMGNISDPELSEDKTLKKPDYLHFANWKKLSDVPWKAKYFEGKNFNKMPYSVNDSAVCYYYEPDVLTPGSFFSYVIYLTTEDTSWYLPNTFVEPARASSAVVETPVEPVVEPVIEPEIEQYVEPVFEEPIFEETVYEDTPPQETNTTSLYDLERIREYQRRLNQFIADEIDLTEQDLNEMETTLEEKGIRQQQN